MSVVSFATPLLLLGLLLLPLLVARLPLAAAAAERYAVRYTNLDVLAGVVESTRSWRRHAGLALFLLALAALLVGFARPSVNRLADREEATIVLVIDVSGSMQAKDVEPTRLEAAQKVVRDFLKGLPKRFQVGVVSFSETAEVAAPATEDRQLAIDAIDYLYPQRGTAIGDGIARGVEVARAAGRRAAAGGATGRPRSCCSPTARRPRACCCRSRARRGRSRSRSRSTRSRSARPRASSSSTASAARGSSRCRPTSRRCARSPRRPAAASTRRRASATCARHTRRWARS